MAKRHQIPAAHLRAALAFVLLASPAAADMDRSFPGGDRAAFEAFLAGAKDHLPQDDLEVFARGAVALALARHPAAALLPPLQRLLMVDQAFAGAGGTMTGLSYREILEYGRAVSGSASSGPSDRERDREARLACMNALVTVELIEVTASPDRFQLGGILRYRIENGLDRAIGGIQVRVSYATEGRAVPWQRIPERLSIPGGVEPGEALTLESQIRLFGWEERPQPIRFEMELVDVTDAGHASFMDAFGGAECPAP